MELILIISFLFLFIIIYSTLEKMNENKKGTCKCVDYSKKIMNILLNREKQKKK